ncbi:MAG: hypothetical protein DRZ80_01250 [Thermoprotei archaeon]|nr:MAG: hypothetical protein DRZ80_01250 [Thermoprotei archaeon]
MISNLFKNLHKILSRDRKKLIACNALFFGVFLVASTYVGYFAIQLHESTRTLLVKNLKTDPIFSTAYEAYYIKKNPLEALFLTFMVNYFIGALLSITLPGFFFLTIPFAALRAMLWGVLFPIPLIHKFLPAIPTLILEGEGYAIAMAPGINISLAVLNPRKYYNVDSRIKALLNALKEIPAYYLVIALVLFIAAIVEVATVFAIKG